jgi:hypothetical protein
MSFCPTCVDAFREKSQAISDRTMQAKKEAREKGKPQAICKDEVNQTYFITDAATAFREHFLIEQVVSGLQD